MISTLINWGGYVLPSFAAALLCMDVYRRGGRPGIAILVGTLTGLVLTMLVGSLFWSVTSICDVCLSQAVK